MFCTPARNMMPQPIRDDDQSADGGQIHIQPSRRGLPSPHVLTGFPQPNLPDRTLPLFDVSADGQHFAVLTGDRAKTTTVTLSMNRLLFHSRKPTFQY